MKLNWTVLEKYEEGFGKDWRAVRSPLGEERGYSPLILQLLWNANIKGPEHAEAFLNPKYENLGDPFLFPDMQKAIDRIFLSQKNNEKIFIYGDYDADGVPGAIILDTVFKAYGINPQIYIPHRETEGYGLNKGAIDYIGEQGGKLIITCDCGISNAEETAYAKEKGIDVIITDHHTLPKALPEAYAIIHPEVGDYPFKLLSGGGVAFKLIQGILKSEHKIESDEKKEAIEKWLLDLVAISTVGDVMPLIDENRILVYYGLKVLNQTKRLGLRKLIEATGNNFGSLDAYSIGFRIAPRINAAGRLDHANAAVNLLLSEDEEEAMQMAESLNKTNSERQRLTDIIVNEAKFQIVEDGQEKNYCLVAFKEGWRLGLLGLAAGKISQEFNRPVILLTEINGEIKGSVRGIDSFNVIKALQKIGELLGKFGGHPAAAGLTLKNKDLLPEFKEKMEELAKADLQDKELLSFIDVNEVEIDDLNLDLAKEITKFAPFGNQNPRPIFCSQGVEICGADTIGNGEKHLRLTVKGCGIQKYKMIGFCFGQFCEALPKIGEKYDIVYEIGVNEWNGREELQLKIIDMERVE
ncbi:single-stranded-DNA-specific exonuclease RecJ [Candidatus Parcubacteria bacterium]|nr:single-stranded-DNA-specific exonuclease RecJ [Patescibacteria group bacterium]MCG2694374.1 single-stranded-DNA-specific exonuclease RecJ [Candidatus Parcubacteria bacterium]